MDPKKTNLICIILILMAIISPAFAEMEFNPSVSLSEDDSILCQIPGISSFYNGCSPSGTGTQGPQGLPGTGNVTIFYNSTAGNSTFFSNQTVFYNLTIGGNITTLSNYTIFNLINITQSEMNQTPGPVGPAGPQGIQGVNGTPGWQGVQGEQGPQGIQGVNGTPGWQGVQGEQGPQGIQGVNGTPGWQGVQGDQGPQGIQGVNGTPGWQGVQGDQGPQGIQGDPGPAGAANMTVGPAGATGPAGLDANVSTMYPITSIFGSTSTTTPNTLLGFGTWSPVYNISTGFNLQKFSATMTSNTAPSGNTTTAISEYSATYQAWKGMDGSATTFWTSTNGGNTGPWWWRWNASYSKVLTNYTIFGRSDDLNCNMRNWTLRGSTDGSTWTTIDTQTEQVWTTLSTPKYYIISNPGEYSFYNFSITRCSFTGTNNCGFGDVEFYNITSMTKGIYYWERTS